MTDYHINIFYSEEDGGYIADIPDLEPCSAFGRTAEEALAEVEVEVEVELELELALRLRLRSRSGQARAAWLEAARAAGRPIPRPRYRPAIYQARGQATCPMPQHVATCATM